MGVTGSGRDDDMKFHILHTRGPMGSAVAVSQQSCHDEVASDVVNWTVRPNASPCTLDTQATLLSPETHKPQSSCGTVDATVVCGMETAPATPQQ